MCACGVDRHDKQHLPVSLWRWRSRVHREPVRTVRAPGNCGVFVKKNVQRKRKRNGLSQQKIDEKRKRKRLKLSSYVSKDFEEKEKEKD